jgi:hypothetical protein
MNMSTITTTDSDIPFVIPSEDIQRLFVMDQTTHSSALNTPAIYSDMSHRTGCIEEYSFTDEEFAKMPSTLMKVVRRTDELLHHTEMVRKFVIDTHNDLKGVHSLLLRYTKKTLKDAEKNDVIAESNAEKGKTKGFRRQCRISDDMCSFMGLTPGATSSRVDVNHAINNYIRTNGLIDPENAQRILPDEKLWSLLSESAKGNRITYFSIQKYIKHHFMKIEK